MSVVSRISTALGNRFRRDFALTLGSNFGVTLISACGGVIAARLLGTDGRGELAAAVVWSGIAGVFVQVALPQSITYHVARYTDEFGAIFYTVLVILVVQSIVLWTVGSLIIYLILSDLQPGIVSTVLTYNASTPFLLLGTYLGTMGQGLKRFGIFNGQRLATSVSYLSTLIVATLAHIDNPQYVVTMLLIVQSSLGLGVLFWVFLRLRPRGSFQKRWASRLLKYGFRSYWGSLSWMANSRLDQFLMSMFVPVGELGQYAIAVTYSTILFPVSGALASTLFAYSSSDQARRAHQRILGVLRTNIAVLISSGIVLSVLAPFVIPFLFGVNYEPSVSVSIVLLIGTVFLGSNYVLSDGLRGLGRPGVVSFAEIAGVFITVLGLLILVPQIGINGAAWTSVIAYASICLFLYIVFRASSRSSQADGSLQVE